jgi:hypothetical protein
MLYQLHFLLELEDLLVEISCLKGVRVANSDSGQAIPGSR